MFGNDTTDSRLGTFSAIGLLLSGLYHVSYISDLNNKKEYYAYIVWRRIIKARYILQSTSILVGHINNTTLTITQIIYIQTTVNALEGFAGLQGRQYVNAVAVRQN